MQITFTPARFVTVLSTCALALTLGCASTSHSGKGLSDALTFHASFDQGLDADFAAGDKQLYGLAATKDIQLATNQGRSGDALHFLRKNKTVPHYKGAGNVAYQSTNWSGTVSFWLKLDPDKDLEPGYCDPLQLSAGSWNDGVFFAEFSKDVPRRFRFALRPLQSIWNPKNLGWEDIAVNERPMVEVVDPPFQREKWTHVVFTFENANTGQKNGVGRLYLNGAFAGEFRDWDLSLKWQPEQIQISLGAAYVGMLDEVALFDRALNEGEIKLLSSKRDVLRSLGQASH